MRSNVVINQNETTLRDINLGHTPSLETTDVVINQSNSQSVPPIEEQHVSSNVPFRSRIPVLIGRRTIQLTTVSYDVPYEDNIIATNNHECI